WGTGKDGRLGDKGTDSQAAPVEVQDVSNAKAVAGGLFHTCALLETGTIQCWGKGDPGTGSELDSNLAQWEGWITQMEDAGIITVFFFFDDDGAWRSDWKDFCDKIVAKFKHHKLLIWGVAEEYNEGRSKTQVSQFAARIREQDEHDHIIMSHQTPGLMFAHASDTNLSMFGMQRGNITPDQVHSDMVNAWSYAKGNTILNMTELREHGYKDDDTQRQINWACALGGVSAVQVLWMGRFLGDRAGTNTQKNYDDCKLLNDFFEATDYNRMIPHDDLKLGASKWVLADTGTSFIAYARGSEGDLGLKNMVGGNYYLHWLDINTAQKIREQKDLEDGNNLIERPEGIGNGEVAVWVVNSKLYDPLDDSVVVIRGGVVGEKVTASLSISAFNHNDGVVFRFQAVPGKLFAVKVYDVHGREVRTLIEGQGDSGIKTVNWDRVDSWGNGVESGCYLVGLHSGGRLLSQAFWFVW
ncbi:MAG: hypothetical protein HQK83_15325, partial [Fibrobacteria bacterium]|nr:hypothetical protein [Fibrobacteria bacterium]